MDGNQVEAALDVLAAVRDLPVDDPVRQRVQRAVDGLVKDAQRRRRADRRRRTVAEDRATVAGAATGAPDRPDGVPVTVPDAAIPPTSPESPSGTAATPDGRGIPSTAAATPDGQASPDVAAVPGTAATAGAAATPGRTRQDRRCYTCRARYRTVDAFYHALCPDCAETHRRHRGARTDLTGRSAVVTGGRVKIGFQVALKLLRDGADVTVVTRFPADARHRYAAEPDFAAWRSALHVIGADLRDPRQVLDLAGRLVARCPRLDILVNNAAQTVRRPDWAYQPLVATELLAAREPTPGGYPEVELVSGYRPGAAMPEWSAAISATVGQVAGIGSGEPGTALARVADATGALLDPAGRNSWTARLGEIDPVELLEVQLVNVVAPFLLVDRLSPALTAAGTQHRYVVNVTGREGWFAGGGGGPKGHPHTAVTKAALNMLTRVGAADLARHGVHMCGVDTGWITDENPAPIRARRAARGWRPPLDVVDAASRIYHPVIQGEAGRPVHGVLLKNFAVVPW